MKPPAGSRWSLRFFDQEIRPAYDKYRDEVHKENLALIVSGDLSEAEAQARFFHEVWRSVAGELGLRYEQTEIE